MIRYPLLICQANKEGGVYLAMERVGAVQLIPFFSF